MGRSVRLGRVSGRGPGGLTDRSHRAWSSGSDGAGGTAGDLRAVAYPSPLGSTAHGFDRGRSGRRVRRGQGYSLYVTALTETHQALLAGAAPRDADGAASAGVRRSGSTPTGARPVRVVVDPADAAGLGIGG